MKVTNKRFSTFVLMILFFVGLNNYLTAQNIQATSYDLKNCIDLAVQNSYQLQSDSLLSKSLEMQVKQEQAGSYPQITGVNR